MARALALFDFDGTLIPGDSIVAFVRYARQAGAMGRGEYLRVLCATVKYLLRGMTDAEIKTRSLRFLRALPQDEREKLAQNFVREILLPQVYQGGAEEIARQRQAGRIVLLVSASTENYMQYVSQALGFDGLLCTPMGEDGAVRDNCKGEGKVRRVREWLARQGVEADWEASFAFGDSKSDRFMLAAVGHPVLVNPRKELKAALPNAETVYW